VINDYEKSVIGTFTKTLFDKINGDEELKENTEVYFTITKFDNDYGFSLIHQEAEPGSDDDGESKIVPQDTADVDALGLNQNIISQSEPNNQNKKLRTMSPAAEKREEYQRQ
jgi:hypothetical protein